MLIKISFKLKYFQNTFIKYRMASVYKSSVQICPIFAQSEFNYLDENQKRYAYYFSKASIEGAKTCLFQVSEQAPAIFALLHLTFGGQPIADLKKQFLQDGNHTEQQWTQLVTYSGAFLSQLGNYKSFAATKFVPEASKEAFYHLITKSINYYQYKEVIEQLWATNADLIYNLGPEYQKIGIFPSGVSGYYSKNLTKQQIDQADELLNILGISQLNTHVYKHGSVIVIKVASVNQSSKSHMFKGKKFIIEYGFFGPFLARVVANLEKAKLYVCNDLQRKMIDAYIEHFQTGDVQLHKQSQRHWVKDKGPIVETNLGFIETYLDPKQVRAYYEGMVSVVDKKASEIVGHLVNNAEKLLEKYIPWPKEFEKDCFLKPDFTSLSVLTFATFDTPRGINIPNYDDIRGEIGFKNVFLANHIINPKNLPPYLCESDGKLLLEYFKKIAFHSVSYHELLGHGCGKLFTQKNGKLNFPEGLLNPLTNQPVKSWFKQNQTWSTKFKNLTNPYQQCRADSVALYYSCFQEAVLLLQPELGENWIKLQQATWINFANMGLNALQFFSAGDKKWMQAHMNGRFVILQVLLEAGQDFVRIEKIKKEEKDSILIHLDRSKIISVGLPALKHFLLRLNVYKATADLENATAMYKGYSEVNQKFLELRQIILANKKQRSLEIKGLIRQKAGVLVYQEFDLTFEGLIEASLANYPLFDIELIEQWRSLRKYHS